MEREKLPEAVVFLKKWSELKVTVERAFVKAIRERIGENLIFPELDEVLKAIEFEYSFNPFTSKVITAKVKVGNRTLGEVEMLVESSKGELIPKNFTINSPPGVEISLVIVENFCELLREASSRRQHNRRER